MPTAPASWGGDPSALLAWTDRLSIAHHLPGRIRLKLATDGLPLAGTAESVRAFQVALSACPGIRSVEINLLARSCLITYQADLIAPSTWVDLVGGVATDAVRHLIKELSAAGAGSAAPAPALALLPLIPQPA